MRSPIRPNHQDDDRLERSRRIGWLNLDNILRSNILVVGAGALGNEVMKNLVLSGVRKITLIDMDSVVRSNLNRCVFFREEDALNGRSKSEVVAERAGALDNGCRITALVGRVQDVGSDEFGKHDIVFGCLDNISTRLHVNAYSYFHHIPYIEGATMGTTGKVQVVLPPDGPCLQCTMNRSHQRILEKRFSCTGNDVTFFEPKMAAEITTTSVVAAVQVREGLKILSGKEDECIKSVWYYDGLANRSDVFEVDLDPDCSVHTR
jgi:molybdopterin/thiamine biosynthesis adenylyltransferase